jgi:hypothetical protein
MLLSAVAALVLFAAPEATQSGAEAQAAEAKPAAAAEAKPEMQRVCTTVEVAGSNLPKKKCKMVPVKTAPKMAEGAAATETAKPE